MNRELAYDTLSNYEWAVDKDCDIMVVGKGLYREARDTIASIVAPTPNMAQATYAMLDAFLEMEEETWQINGHVTDLEREINSAFGDPYESFDISDPDSWAYWLDNQVDEAREYLRDELDIAYSDLESANESASDWEDRYYSTSADNDDLRDRVSELEEEVSSLYDQIYDLEQELKKARDATDTGCDATP